VIRRTFHRAAGAVLLAAVACGAAPGCSADVPSVGAAAPAQPGCVEVDGTLAMPAEPWPAEGRLPEGFVPVAIVECRSRPSPDAKDVVERRATNLDALVAVLGLPSEPLPPSAACPAVGYLPRHLVLLDAAGHGYRPLRLRPTCSGWPAEVKAALDGLEWTVVRTG